MRVAWKIILPLKSTLKILHIVKQVKEDITSDDAA